MIRTLVHLISVAVVSAGALSGAIVGHTFVGETYMNPAVELDEEFPIGTMWEVRVEWDDAATGEVFADSQASYPLTKMTLTLKGKSGNWTTSSLPGKASMSLNRFGSHEIQFTGGWSPESYTNKTIPGGATYSINVVLSDPTNTALPDITKAPGAIDTKMWSSTNSQLKFYISEDAKAIFGNVDGLGEVTTQTLPEISMQQPKGKELRDAKSAIVYEAVRKGREGETKTFVIRNKGNAPLKNLRLVIGGRHRKDFVTGGLTRKSLAPGERTTFKVTFKPTAVGKRKGIVRVESNDQDENPFTVSLTGTGK